MFEVRRARSGASNARGKASGRAESPDTATPAIVRAGPVLPMTVRRAPVVHQSGYALRVRQEAEREPSEFERVAIGVGLPRHGDQHPRHVVGAIPMRSPRLPRGLRVRTCRSHRSWRRGDRSDPRRRAVRARPSHRHQVADGEQSLGRARRIDRPPRSTTGRAPSGALPPPSRPSRSMSVSTARMAAARASGSRWGTTVPAPLLNSSTACGNAVETTGRPAATASTKTPDVT